MNIVPADGVAPVGARAFTGTNVTTVRVPYVRPSMEGLHRFGIPANSTLMKLSILAPLTKKGDRYNPYTN